MAYQPDKVIQTVNQSYLISTKQMLNSATDGCSRKKGLYSRSGDGGAICDMSEEGQIQISDLEPLSTQMDLQRTSSRVNLTDLKLRTPYLNQQLANNTDYQAGKFSIQIRSTYRTADGDVSDCHPTNNDPLNASNHGRHNSDDILELANGNGDASYESPDNKEAARIIRQSYKKSVNNSSI